MQESKPRFRWGWIIASLSALIISGGLLGWYWFGPNEKHHELGEAKSNSAAKPSTQATGGMAPAREQAAPSAPMASAPAPAPPPIEAPEPAAELSEGSEQGSGAAEERAKSDGIGLGRLGTIGHGTTPDPPKPPARQLRREAAPSPSPPPPAPPRANAGRGTRSFNADDMFGSREPGTADAEKGSAPGATSGKRDAPPAKTAKPEASSRRPAEAVAAGPYGPPEATSESKKVGSKAERDEDDAPEKVKKKPSPSKDKDRDKDVVVAKAPKQAASTAAAPTERDRCEAAARALAHASPHWISGRVPEKMPLGRTVVLTTDIVARTVDVRLAPPINAFAEEGRPTPSQTYMHKLPGSLWYRVELKASPQDFEITAIAPPVQRLNEGSGSWQWAIMAKRTGALPLALVASNLSGYEGCVTAVTRDNFVIDVRKKTVEELRESAVAMFSMLSGVASALGAWIGFVRPFLARRREGEGEGGPGSGGRSPRGGAGGAGGGGPAGGGAAGGGSDAEGAHGDAQASGATTEERPVVTV